MFHFYVQSMDKFKMRHETTNFEWKTFFQNSNFIELKNLN